MIDLVQRLRFDAFRCELQFSKGVTLNIEEAADRIEQLEAALRGLYEFNIKHQPDLIDTRIMLIARAALAPEQDK